MNYDQKLVKNIEDDIERLHSQLKDLETYKSDFSDEEYENLKKESVEKLEYNSKLLEKMLSGSLTTSSNIDNANKKIKEILCQNYNVKELLNSFLANETYFLREKLAQVNRDYTLNKIQVQVYEMYCSQIIEAISKNTKLNDSELNLHNKIKNKMMNFYENDQGIDQKKIEEKLIQK